MILSSGYHRIWLVESSSTSYIVLFSRWNLWKLLASSWRRGWLVGAPWMPSRFPPQTVSNAAPKRGTAWYDPRWYELVRHVMQSMWCDVMRCIITYMYVYMYMCVCVCMCMCICICVWMYTYMYVCIIVIYIYIYIYVCIHTCGRGRHHAVRQPSSVPLPEVRPPHSALGLCSIVYHTITITTL